MAEKKMTNKEQADMAVELAARIEKATDDGRMRAAAGSNWPTARIHELGGMAGRGKKVAIPPKVTFINSDYMG